MEFSKLKYRVDLVPTTKEIALEYPDLKRVPIFLSPLDLPEGLTADLCMRYIILMFGQGSPFINEIPDLNKRKGAVLRFLNIEPDENKKYPDYIAQMTSYMNDSVRSRVVTFLRISRSEDWALALACEQKNADLIAQMFLPKEDIKEEKTLQEAMKLNREALVEARERLLVGEDSKIVQETVMQFLTDENLGIRPEEYMDEFSETKTVFKEIIP